MNIKLTFALIASLTFTAFTLTSHATVVEIRTVMGNVQVNLFDEATPETVANFLEYVNSGAYANNTVHRSANNFVIQMGGFQYSNAFPPEPIATGAPVKNEPELSNVRGTLAMAKLGGDPNSATSQFFINVSNNSANLDVQNGGFTVFGQVIGDSMIVVDNIAALNRFNFGGTFNEIPLRNYTVADAGNNVMPNDNNVVIINDIVVVDTAIVTNPNLNPVTNTLINSVTQPSTQSGSSGGGVLNSLLLVTLSFIGIIRKSKITATHFSKQLRLLTNSPT